MKNILITGVYGGMGKATYRLLTEKGYDVFGIDICDNKDNLNNYYQTDITSLESIQNTYRLISKEINDLYAIIHMAGIYKMDSLLEIDEKDFLKIFDVNLNGIYRINKVFMPLLKNESKIIITSSEVAPLDPMPFNGLYSITKAAVEKYAFSLRMEVNLLGIRVSILRPGAVKTNLLNDSMSELDKFCNKTNLYKTNSLRFKKIVSKIETKSIKPEKIAEKVLKIISIKKPKYIYNINRSLLLRIFNFLPDRLQVWIIKNIIS